MKYRGLLQLALDPAGSSSNDVIIMTASSCGVGHVKCTCGAPARAMAKGLQVFCQQAMLSCAGRNFIVDPTGTHVCMAFRAAICTQLLVTVLSVFHLVMTTAAWVLLLVLPHRLTKSVAC